MTGSQIAVLLTPDDAELLAHAWWDESGTGIPWSDVEPIVQAGYIDAARDWITRAANLRGSGHRDVELVPTAHQSRVKVVVYRDPNSPNDIVVFLDGHQVSAEVHNVADPAAVALIREPHAGAETTPHTDDIEGAAVTIDEFVAHDPFPDWDQVAEPYAAARAHERFVVTLVVAYDPDTAPDVTTPQAAAAAALDLTRDGGRRGTVWHVYDRRTGQTHSFEQSEFEKGEGS